MTNHEITKPKLVKDVDLNEKRLYSGQYSSYSDEELMELIDTALFFPANQNYKEYGGVLFQGREDLIHNGKTSSLQGDRYRFAFASGYR